MDVLFVHYSSSPIPPLLPAWSELYFQELFQDSRFAGAGTYIDKNMSSGLIKMMDQSVTGKAKAI